MFGIVPEPGIDPSSGTATASVARSGVYDATQLLVDDSAIEGTRNLFGEATDGWNHSCAYDADSYGITESLLKAVAKKKGLECPRKAYLIPYPIPYPQYPMLGIFFCLADKSSRSLQQRGADFRIYDMRIGYYDQKLGENS